MIGYFYRFFKTPCLLFPVPLFLAAVFLCVTATAETLTLKDIFATTNVRNPDLLAARIRVLEQAETIEQAYGAVRPQLHIAINGAITRLTDEDKTRTDRFNTDSYNDAGAALVLNQQIYAGGALWAAVDVAEAGLRAVLQDLRATEQDILMQALRAYVNYTTAVETLVLRRENVGRLAKHLQATQTSFALGKANRTDVALAESRHASALAEEDAAEVAEIDAATEYYRIVGTEPPAENILPVATSAEDIHGDIFDNIEEFVEAAVKFHPLIQAADFRVQEAKHTVRLRRAEHLPHVSASASVRHDDSDAPMRPDNEQSVVVSGQVRIPLYSGGTTAGKVRAARYGERRQQQSYTATRRLVAQIAISAWEQHAAAQSQKQARTAAKQAAELALEGVVTEYQLGTRSILDVLDSEQITIEAAIAEVTAYSNELITLFQMGAAVGQMTVTALDINDPLAQVASAIGEGKGIRRAIRKTDRDGNLQLQEE